MLNEWNVFYASIKNSGFWILTYWQGLKDKVGNFIHLGYGLDLVGAWELLGWTGNQLKELSLADRSRQHVAASPRRGGWVGLAGFVVL